MAVSFGVVESGGGSGVGREGVVGGLVEQGVELPEVGRTYKKGEVAGVVESVKAAADIYMPVTGEVVEVNTALKDDPSLANSDPLGNGWFFKVHVTNMAEFDALMDPPAYDALLKTL